MADELPDLVEDTPLGFAARAPAGLWNKRIGVDYPGVFKALLKAPLAAATGNPFGVVSAAIDSMFAFRLQNEALSPAELSWLLIRRALAHAMARLSVEALRGREWRPEDKEKLVEALDRTLDSAEIHIEPRFFRHPAELPVLAALSEPFREWLHGLGLDEAGAAAVERRLGAYLTFALHREWAKDAPGYRPLEQALREADTPFAAADPFSRLHTSR